MSRYGQGRIYQRGRQWWIRYSVRGQRFDEPAGERREDAVNLLKKRHGEAASRRVLTPVAEKVTLKDVFDMLAANYRLKRRKSEPPTAQLLERFGPDFKAMDLTLDVLTRYT